jgi:hypothetical protein
MHIVLLRPWLCQFEYIHVGLMICPIPYRWGTLLGHISPLVILVIDDNAICGLTVCMGISEIIRWHETVYFPSVI